MRVGLATSSSWPIEEGLKQKTRQNVVVLDWGSRSNAALGNFGVKVWHCVHRCCTFSLYFCGGMFYVDLYFEFLYRSSKKSQYNTLGLQYLPECLKTCDAISIDI